MTDTSPDFEGFAKAVLEQWPTGDIDGCELFELCVSYGMVREIPGGYDPEHHIDAEGIGPERGDPWYEYTFDVSKGGPGLFSVLELRAERDALKKGGDALAEALEESVLYFAEFDGLRRQAQKDLAAYRAISEGKTDDQ